MGTVIHKEVRWEGITGDISIRAQADISNAPSNEINKISDKKRASKKI